MKIFEGISFNGEKFNFDFSKDSLEDICNLQFANTKTKSKQFGINIYSAWRLIFGEKNKEAISLFRKELKKESNLISTQDKERLIKKAVIGFDSKFDVASYDIIIFPKSSSSLVFDIAKVLKSKSTNTLFVSDIIVKNKLENIKIDYDSYMNSAKTPEDKEWRKKQLDNDFKHATKTGDFQIKKVHQFRKKMFSNFLTFDDKVTRQIYNAISNGKVLIVDDILTTGSTLKEMVTLVNSYTPKEITFFVLIR